MWNGNTPLLCALYIYRPHGWEYVQYMSMVEVGCWMSVMSLHSFWGPDYMADFLFLFLVSRGQKYWIFSGKGKDD